MTATSRSDGRAKRMLGTVCVKHPDLSGERYATLGKRQGDCVACVRERKQKEPPESRWNDAVLKEMHRAWFEVVKVGNELR